MRVHTQAKAKKMMTVGSLFTGIGGLDLGLERAGMAVVWQVENNPFSQQVLAKRWPDVRRYGDVKDVGQHDLVPVDLVCGGFPCAPVSVAGKRRGAEDKRWLWPEFYRIKGAKMTEITLDSFAAENLCTYIQEKIAENPEFAGLFVEWQAEAGNELWLWRARAEVAEAENESMRQQLEICRNKSHR